MLRRAVLVALSLACASGFRDVSKEPNKSFPAYAEGFVGQTADPTNLLSEHINEGAHDSTAKPVSQAAVATQICPGMVGPFTGDLYYCTGKEFGYCDRRNGVCFCNIGYQGLDCSQCTHTHFKIGHLCYPKKLCPNGCSGGGVCDYYGGTCNCDVGRVGEDCSQTLCSSYDPNCEDCTSTHCVRCVSGFSLLLGRCEPCHRFDPRCVDCNSQECLECADMVLLSIQRSGARPGIDPQLPFDEVNRTYSLTFPFGSTDPRYFDEAEAYIVARGPKQEPLNASTISCDQGTAMDANWVCAPASTSNVVCGHVGRFTFSSPTYKVNENEPYVRISVQRSGGGVGQAEVSYALTHITTSPSDVGPVAAYTTVQTLQFEPGVIEKSFLIPIYDDTEVEGDEMFQLSLRNPSKLSDVGNTDETLVTIVDDDKPWQTQASTSKLGSTEVKMEAGSTATVIVHAVDATGHSQQMGGDVFYGLVGDSAPFLGFQNTRQPLHIFSDVGDGSFALNITLTHESTSALRVFLLKPGGWRGTYFCDSWLINPLFDRVDRYINFTWHEGLIAGNQADYTSVRWVGVLSAPVSSKYSFTVHCDDHARLIIDGVVRIDAWDAVIAPVFRTYSTSWEVGSLHKVELEYRDLQGNAFVRLQWQYHDMSQPADIPSSAVFFEEEVLGSPVKITTTPAAADPSRTECLGDGLFQCKVGKVAQFWICPKDRYGNERQDVDAFHAELDEFYVSLTLQSSLAAYEVSAVVSYNQDIGCFEASYVVDAAGVYQLDVVMRSAVTGDTIPVYGSPFNVVAAPGDALGTTARIYDLRNHTTAGVPLLFVVEVRDLSFNVRTQGGDDVEVHAIHTTTQTTEYGSVLDHHTGNYSASIMLPRTGTYQLFVEVNGVLLFEMPVRIAVSSNVPEPSTSTCSIDAIGRVGFELSARIFLRDGWSNALTIPPTSYNISTYLLGKKTTLESAPVYDGAGQWSVQFVPQDIGANVLGVIVDGTTFCNGTAISQIADGEGSSADSFVYGSGLHSATAGQVASFYIQAVDAQGHIREESGDIFDVSIVSPTATATASVKYSGKGVYEVSFIPTVSGWYNVTVLLSDGGVSTQLPLPQPPQLYVLPSVPIATTSRLLHADAMVEAGVESTVSIHLHDFFGNPLELGGELVKTTWFSQTGQQAFASARVTDSGDGSYTMSFTPTKVDTYTVVTAVAEHALLTTYYEANTTETVIHSFVDTAPLQLSRTVQPRSVDGTNLSVTEFWAEWEGWILPPLREPFEFSVKVDSYSTAFIKIGQTIVCDTGNGDSNSGVFMFESLEAYPILVQYRHSQYESLLAIDWKSPSFSDRPLDVEYLRTYRNVSVNTTNVVCSEVCPSCTTATGGALERAVAGVSAHFSIDARDRFHNHITDAGTPVNVTLVRNGQTQGTGSVVETEPGIFHVAYTAQHAGTSLFYVTIGCCAPDPVADGIAAFLEFAATHNIKGSPFTVAVRPGQGDGAQTFATGASLNASVAGVNSTFVVHMRDSQGNPTADFTLDLLDIRTVINGHDYAPTWQFSMHNDRVFCTYTIRTAGTYSLQLYYNNSMFQDSPFELVVMPAKASADFTRPFGHHLTVAQVGMPVYFRIESIDAFMNPLNFGGHKFFVRIYGAETVTPHFSDERNGWYRVNYTIPTHAGIYDVHVMLLSSAVGSMRGDGVIAEYFESPLLEGAPLVTRLEDHVALSCNDSHAPALPEGARSVRWSGFLYIPLNDLYVFMITSDQRVDFYFDGHLLFQANGTTEGTTLSPPLRLFGGTSYRVKIELFTMNDDHSSASIEWFWEAARTNRATVPTLYLHSQGTPIVASPYRLTASLPKT